MEDSLTYYDIGEYEIIRNTTKNVAVIKKAIKDFSAEYVWCNELCKDEPLSFRIKLAVNLKSEFEAVIGRKLIEVEDIGAAISKM